MELYLHYAEASDECSCKGPCPRCQSRKHLAPLLECAYPRLDLGSSTDSPYDAHAKRRDTVFFSQQELQKYFKKPEVIEELLLCGCHQCKPAREKTSARDDGNRRSVIENSPQGQLLFAVMVYLRKFHFVYAWFVSDYTERDFRYAISELDRHDIFDSYMTNEMEKRLFKAACGHALEMFDPVKLKFSVSPTNYVGSNRFPFLAEKEITGGNFGTLTKFEVAEEYCINVQERMKRYPTSTIGHGKEKRLLFARKSVKTSDDYSNTLALAEQDMLRMVYELQKPAADNIITLLACYNWRDEMHFVFPYIEADLEGLLNGKIYKTDIVSLMFQNNRKLPENKLWQEMVGVTEALSAIHTGMPNPFKGSQGDGRVFACHFDLKPANILVTGDGKLQIADFGHSHIEIVKPEDQPEAQYRGGDPRYAAPESQLSMKEAEKVPQSHESSTVPAIKYDVWSLACIMIEVLIRLLNPLKSRHPLKQFREGLEKCQQGSLYKGQFFNEQGVKNCVTTVIDALKKNEPSESAIDKYLSAIGDLLLDMFQPKNHLRLDSRGVLVRLKVAKTKYQEGLGLDALGMALRRHSLLEAQAFREIGWTDQSGELVSFIKMGGINLEVVDRENANTRWSGDCRIQLFDKRSSLERNRASRESERQSRESTRLGRQNMPNFVLCYAVGVKEDETGDPDNIYDDDTHREIRYERHKEKVSFPDWEFRPTYLFQEDKGSFECLLFPVKENAGDNALVFTFQSRKDLHAFQGALFQKRIFSRYEITKASIEVDICDRPGSKRLDSVSVQFWATHSLNYLPNPSSDELGHQVVGPSNTENKDQEIETMVIFSPGEKKPLLQVPLDNNQKKFTLEGRDLTKAMILPRPRDGNKKRYRYFDASEFQSPSCDPWRRKDVESDVTKFTTPAVQTQNGKPVKVERMTIMSGEGEIRKLIHATKTSKRANWK